MSDKTTLNAVDFAKIRDKLRGRKFVVDTVFSLDEGKEGNVTLAQYNAANNSPGLGRK